MQYNIGDNVSIIDKKTNEVIAAGRINGIKDIFKYNKKILFFFNKEIISKMFCISFDTKYFFNIDKDTFIVKPSNIEKKFDVSLLSRYSHIQYSGNTPGIDIYIENTIDELDEEVVQLVHLLNKIPGVITSGSCSGHNIGPLWVSMTFRDIYPIKFLADILNKKFYNEFNISTINTRSQNTKDGVELCIISTNKGKKAFLSTIKLCEYLEVAIQTLYNE